MINQELLIALVKALASQHDPAPPDEAITMKPLGWRIVQLDRAYTWVGDCYDAGDSILIKDALNIRIWGTTKGLGELAAGPTAKTVMDRAGEIEAPKRAVIFTLKTEGEKWRR